ncbi:MAG: hypothetical protein ABEH40_04845 [Haloferacaceae archaeon]
MDPSDTSRAAALAAAGAGAGYAALLVLVLAALFVLPFLAVRAAGLPG